MDFVEKVKEIRRADWGYNTNVKAVFDLILEKAKKYNLEQKDIPEIVYIISDMEFDQAQSGSKDALFFAIKKEFEQHGYKLPHLVFWNVDSRQNNIPLVGVGNYSLVSGFSPVIFEMVAGQKSAIDVLNDVLSKKRYSVISKLLSN